MSLRVAFLQLSWLVPVSTITMEGQADGGTPRSVRLMADKVLAGMVTAAVRVLATAKFGDAVQVVPNGPVTVIVMPTAPEAMVMGVGLGLVKLSSSGSPVPGYKGWARSPLM